MVMFLLTTLLTVPRESNTIKLTMKVPELAYTWVTVADVVFSTVVPSPKFH